MRFLSCAAVLFLLNVSGGSASGQPGPLDTGAAFMKLCETNPPNSQSGIACSYYISGFSQGLAIASIASEQQGRHVCIPDATTGEQIQVVVHKFLNEHPELLDRPAPALIGAALYAAFPCQKSN